MPKIKHLYNLPQSILSKLEDRPTICFMPFNAGWGKTNWLTSYVVDNPNFKVLYKCDSYRNVDEVFNWIVRKGGEMPFIHYGKDYDVGAGNLCAQPEGHRYVNPGCRGCEIHPADEHRRHPDCPYWHQYDIIGAMDHGCVITTAYSAHLGTKFAWDTEIDDELVEGTLFSSYTNTLEDYASAYLEPDHLPYKGPHRPCDGTCAVESCRVARFEHECKSAGPLMSVTFTATHNLHEVDDATDEMQMLHWGLLPKRDSEGNIIPGRQCRSNYDYFHDCPLVVAFTTLPIPNAREVIFASASVTETMARNWIFPHFLKKGWRLWNDAGDGAGIPDYINPVSTFDGWGTVASAHDYILGAGGILDEIHREHLGQKGLMVVKKEEWDAHVVSSIYPWAIERPEKATPEQIQSLLKKYDVIVDYYPLQGVNDYRMLNYAILTCLFRFDTALRQILGEVLGWPTVEHLEYMRSIQAAGRIRPAFVDPQRGMIGTAVKPIYYLGRDRLPHIPNSRPYRVRRSARHIREQLAKGYKSANKLFAEMHANPFFVSNRNVHMQVYRQVVDGTMPPDHIKIARETYERPLSSYIEDKKL